MIAPVEDDGGNLFFDGIPLCKKCHGEMLQLTGFLTYYCPYCSSEKECIEWLLNDICSEDSEAAEILKDLMKKQ
jgi:hypothetical protein